MLIAIELNLALWGMVLCALLQAMTELPIN